MRFLIIWFCGIIPVFGQEHDPVTIINDSKSEYGKIKDFTADAEINVNVDFIKIPRKYATVYFKSPDKYRFISPGFIMIPKKGLNFSVQDLLMQPATIIYIGTFELEGDKCDEIKAIPEDGKSDLVLATFYISTLTHYVKRIEANTKKTGAYSVNLDYGLNKLPLPEEIQITFDIEKISFPLKFMGDMKVENKGGGSNPEPASVTIKYTHYKVNIGLNDQIFVEEPGLKNK